MPPTVAEPETTLKVTGSLGDAFAKSVIGPTP